MYHRLCFARLVRKNDFDNLRTSAGIRAYVRFITEPLRQLIGLI
ncbi:hypothetical protein [Moraxella equi]|nr:hypothetical protein [Moraxella equi]